MTSTFSRNLESINQQQLRTEFNQLSTHSFLNSDKGFKSRFEESFLIVQENAKQLQKIQKKTLQLRQKQKRQREYLRRLKKIYEQQLKQFQELQKITKLSLEDKSREIEFLTMQNNQLKEQSTDFQTLKGDVQILNIQNNQINAQNKRLSQQLTQLQQNYRTLNIRVEQQSELIEKGIQSNQIQTQSATNAFPGSLQEVEQLNNVIEEQKRRQIQEAVQNDKQKLKGQTDEINSILEVFLKQFQDIQVKQKNQNKQVGQNIQSSQTKLDILTQELKNKSLQISKVIANSHKLQKDLKNRETQIQDLSSKLRQQQQQCQSKNSEILNIKEELQICQDSQQVRINTDIQVHEKKAKNFQTFEKRILQLIQDKKLKQYLIVYDTFSITSTDIFNTFRKSFYQRNDSGEKFIESIMEVIELNLNKLNDYFREKARQEIQKIHKMTGFIEKASSVLQKQKSDQDIIDQEEKNSLSQSTPDRFGFKSAVQHRRQQLETSTKSYRKSIVLEQDIDSAVNCDEDMDRLKEEALNEQHSNLKNNQVNLDSLREDKSEDEQQLPNKDVISESSFNRSKFSELSQGQQQRNHSDKRKTALLNAKLKKKKKQ